MAQETWGESVVLDENTDSSGNKPENQTTKPLSRKKSKEHKITKENNKEENNKEENNNDEVASENEEKEQKTEPEDKPVKGKKSTKKSKKALEPPAQPSKKSAKPATKKHKVKTSKKDLKKDKKSKEIREESIEWKRQAKKYGRTKKSMRVLGTIIIVLLIILSVLGYVYFFQIDTDADGIPDISDSDDDNDEIPDWWEEHYDFNPKDANDADDDPDGDNLDNRNEYNFHSDPLLKDTDSDGLNDFDEWDNRDKDKYGKSTDPNNPDSDHDGMPDGWEVKYDLNPVTNDAWDDIDQDGFDVNHNGKLEKIEFYSNLEEYENGTIPKNKDTDSDGLWDGWEIYFRDECLKIRKDFQQYNDIGHRYYNYTLDPNNPADAAEDIDVSYTEVDEDIDVHLTPDGLTNIEEFTHGTHPTSPDTDNDNLTDSHEINVYHTDPLHWDSDGDGLWDGWEVKYGGTNAGLNPNAIDTDGDGTIDRFEDLDADGLDNNRESEHETSPLLWDTDHDGMPDGWEVFTGCLEPLIPDDNSDSDGDLLINKAEFENGTEPCNNDTDRDGLSDGEELIIGFPGILINGEYRTNTTARYFTDPITNDTDGDGILDGVERDNGWNASNPDTDQDGLLDLEEYTYRTNPANKDTDNDKLTDWEEVNKGNDGYITLPTNNDTDNDGLLDGDEVLTDFLPFNPGQDSSNPIESDTDNDGLPDGWEWRFGYTENMTVIKNYDQRYGTKFYDELQANKSVAGIWLVNPLNSKDRDEDADYDGYDDDDDGMISKIEEFNNSEEFDKDTQPVVWDTDNDGMSDGWEIAHYGYSTILSTWGPDPTIKDGHLDLDGDGVDYYVNRIKYYDDFTNLEEYHTGNDLNNDGIIDSGTTHPNRPFSEPNQKDPDYYLIWYGDDDNDTLYNGWELIFNGDTKDPNGYTPDDLSLGRGNFSPTDPDSDGDGTNDADEDLDNDGYSNKDEQGDVRNWPGSSDPTDPYMDPKTIYYPSRDSGGSRSACGSSTKIEYELSSSFFNNQRNNYGENIYEKYQITTYYNQIKTYEQLTLCAPSSSNSASLPCSGDTK